MEGHDPPSPGAPGRPEGGVLRRLGDFDIVREIGRGGMGVVYEAQQRSLHRRIALKVLPPGLGLTAQAVQRFQREAQAAAQLHHTHIVPVYAVGEEQGCHYYAMELIEGQPLAAILSELRGEGSSPLLQAAVSRIEAEGGSAAETAIPRAARNADGAARSGAPPPPSMPSPVTTSHGLTSLSDTSSGSRKWFDTAAHLIADVADALHYAHGRGVVHRDVKPANLLLSRDGRLCVSDFGLARVAQEPGMTVSGSFLGTPAYMSPEQIAAGRVKVDHRTDVYSLGTVLYELLTLERPFPGENREEILAGIMTKEPRGPRRINPRVPVDLETICLKALEKDPDRRYSTARGMAQDLRSYLQRGLITARRAGALRRVGKFVRRHPVGTMAVAATLLLAAVGGVAWRATSRQAVESAMRALADARLHMNQGEYRDALRHVEQALALESDLPEAHLIRARLLIKMNRAADAAAEAEGLLKRNPDEWTAHLILAAAARSQEGGARFGTSVDEHVKAVEAKAPDTADAHYLRSLVADTDTAALEHLDRALALDPGHADALFERSQRLNSLHRFDAALADCDRLIAARPRSARARLQKARVYEHRQDEIRVLEEEIERAVVLDPEDAACLRARGEVRANRGRHKEAIDDFGKAIALDPDDWRCYMGRGQSYLEMGQVKEALADFERALAADPQDVEPYLQLAGAHRALGELDQARATLDGLERAAATWTDLKARAGAHRAMADAYREVGENERAIEEAERAIALDRGSWEYLLVRAHLRRIRGDTVGFETDCASAAGMEIHEPHDFLGRGGQLALVCNRSDLALADVARGIEFDRSWGWAYSLRAYVYDHLNRFEESLVDRTKAIEAYPDHPVTRAQRGETYSAMARFEEAVADYDKAIQLAPDLAWLYSNRGWALLELGRISQALADLNKAVELSPDQIDGRAWAYLKLGRVEDAIADWDKAVEALATPWRHASGAYFLTYKPGSCERAAADLRQSEAVMPEQARDAGTLQSQASVHLLGLYYSCPELYDGQRALELARRAVLLEPHNKDARGMLGVALYRNGHHDEAMKTLLEVLPTRTEDPSKLLFLAMTSHRLGKRAEARRYYDRAVAWMKTHFPSDVESLRFRAEAQKVLGVAM